MKFFVTNSIAFFLILTSLISCKKDWLDVKTQSSLAVPMRLKDFQAILNNAELMNFDGPAGPEIASDGHHLTDNYFQTSSVFEKNCYTWSHQYPYIGVNDWFSAYIRIFNCNFILEGLQKIKDVASSDTSNYNDIKGQALFLRAKNYYELAQMFAPPFLTASAKTDLSIPLRLESDINIPSRHSTTQQTYDQIIADLTEAKNLLPEFSLYKARASKAAALAMLARVQLTMENYSEAGKNADACLQINGSLLDFNKKDEVDSSKTYPISRFNKEVYFHSTIAYWGSTGYAVVIDKDLYDSYANDDLRKGIYFKNSASDVLFRGTYAGDLAALFNGIAVDEMYLIRAECNARSGKIQDAMTDLKTLMTKRWRNGSTLPDYSGVNNADDALRIILQERNKELILRGIRWSDLRRLNHDPKFQVILTRKFGFQPDIKIPPNDYRYTFPIPDDIIKMTGIQQNPGW